MNSVFPNSLYGSLAMTTQSGRESYIKESLQFTYGHVDHDSFLSRYSEKKDLMGRVTALPAEVFLT